MAGLEGRRMETDLVGCYCSVLGKCISFLSYCGRSEDGEKQMESKYVLGVEISDMWLVKYECWGREMNHADSQISILRI